MPGETCRSWAGIATLTAVAMAGAIGLSRLAYHVTTPKPQANEGIIVRSEIVSVWLHPALLDLARHPSEYAAWRSHEDFRRYAEQHGLENAWHVITAKEFKVNGETEVLSTIRRPYDMIPAHYQDLLDVMATAAGTPPSYPSTDFSTSVVRVIPGCFLDADPRAAFDDLRMLERLPDQTSSQ
jgi:hypothetical protein